MALNLASAAAIAAAFLPAVASAIDVHWTSLDGNWNDSTKWTPAQVPGNADVAIVDNAAAGSTAHVNSNNPQVQRIDLLAANVISIETGAALSTSGDANFGVNTAGTVTHTAGNLTVGGWGFVGKNGGSGTYTQSGGTHLINNRGHIGFSDGPGPGGSPPPGAPSTGVYNLNGGTYQINNDLALGVNGSSGTMNQDGGTVNAGWTFVGKNQDGVAGSVGDYNLSSGSLNVAGTMSVGFGGASAGTFDHTGGNVTVIKQGADNNSGNLNVGIDGGTATYTQSGGMRSSHWAFVGRGGGAGGSNGTYNHSSGTSSTQGWLRIAEGANTGTYNLTGNAVLNVGGGDADTGDDDLYVGVDGGANGTLNINNTSQLTVARDTRVGVNGGTGVVNQSGGTHSIAGVLFIAQGAASTGTYNLTGGTLDLTGGDISPGGGTAIFNMSGGRLEDAAAINLRLDQLGGVLAPGAGIGTTTITGNGMQAYQLGTAGTLEVELATSASFDQVIANAGSVGLFGNLDLIASPGLSFGDEFTIIDITDPTKLVVGEFIGKPDDSTFSEDGYAFQINYNAGPDLNNVTLTVVPEPAVIGMMGVALLACLARRRRRD